MAGKNIQNGDSKQEVPQEEPRDSKKDLSLKISLWIVAFTVGAVILVLELLASGWLAPIYGRDLHVWGVILGVTLFSLALGYFLGSATAKGISFFFLPYLLALGGLLALGTGKIFLIYSQKGISFSTPSLFFWTLIILGLPLLALALVSPWIIELYSRLGVGPGKAAGLIYGISTLGSVLGALGAGFWAIPMMGLWNSLCYSAWALVFGILNCAVGNRKNQFHSFIAAGILGLGCLAAYLAPPSKKATFSKNLNLKLLYRDDSWYGRREVYDDGTRIHLVVDGILQTGMPKEGLGKYPAGSFIRSGYVMELLPYLYPQGREALVIGLGGGLLSTYFQKYGWDILSLEVDPVMVALAQKFFYFQGKYKIMDGRVYLQQHSRKWDFILVDVFRGAAMPSHFTTLEFFQLLSKRLKPKGILAMNLIGHPKGRDIRSILKTAHVVFPHILFYDAWGDQEFGNLTLFARLVPLPLARAERALSQRNIFIPNPYPLKKMDFTNLPILRDYRNPLPLYRQESLLKWREETFRLFNRSP
ncbi:MAG: hypothetical protein D6785_05595 [Planctomycetota bacterium]|nr:MAG: hypothetical protein D6785_05595 [Planctomycetota bacterium]